MSLVRINDDTIINTDAVVSIVRDNIQGVTKSVILLTNGDVIQSILDLSHIEDVLNGND